MNMATWTVVGISIGAALGSATDNMGAWLSCGAALGLVIGSGTRSKSSPSTSVRRRTIVAASATAARLRSGVTRRD
jgi:hypothetical protein